MTERAAGFAGKRALARFSACVCSALRVVARAVTQLYDDVLRPSGFRMTQWGKRSPASFRRTCPLG